MFDSPLGHSRRPPAVLSLTAILAAALLVAAPAHGFGLSGTQFVEGLGKVGDAVKSAQEAERHDRSGTEQFVVDKAGEIADKATDAIGQASIKLSRKAWDALKKSDSKRLGELAKKTAKRWGPAAMKALRLAGPVGTVVATADASITVGSAIGKHGVVPLMDRFYFDGKNREIEEQIRSQVKEIRKRGEFSRRLDEDIAAYQREARAMEEEERALYRPDGSNETSAPNAGGTEHDPWSPAVRRTNRTLGGRTSRRTNVRRGRWMRRSRGCTARKAAVTRAIRGARTRATQRAIRTNARRGRWTRRSNGCTAWKAVKTRAIRGATTRATQRAILWCR